jgi:hypothetical protein
MSALDPMHLQLLDILHPDKYFVYEKRALRFLGGMLFFIFIYQIANSAFLFAIFKFLFKEKSTRMFTNFIAIFLHMFNILKF